MPSLERRRTARRTWPTPSAANKVGEVRRRRNEDRLRHTNLSLEFPEKQVFQQHRQAR